MELTKQAFVLGGALLLVVIIMWFYMGRLRRRGQTDLAEVHRELLTIYNTIPDGIFKCRADEDFTLIDANDGFFKDIGYTREELKLRFDDKLTRLVSPEIAQRVKESLQRQKKTGAISRDEVRLEGKDGTKKWLLLSGTIAEDPREEHVVYCSVTDISELKITQEKLRDA
ncbi:MAG: PAS domain S-box protein, partial [Angelakisella sp.]